MRKSLRSTGSSGCQSIVDTGRYPKQELEQDLQDLKDLYRDAALGPSTEAIVKEAGKGILDLHRHSLYVQLGYGVNQKRMQATMSAQTSILGVELASDKEGTKRILADAEYQCQKAQLSTTWTSLKKRLKQSAAILS